MGPWESVPAPKSGEREASEALGEKSEEAVGVDLVDDRGVDPTVARVCPPCGRRALGLCAVAAYPTGSVAEICFGSNVVSARVSPSSPTNSTS
jgi:hypothetical protein